MGLKQRLDDLPRVDREEPPLGQPHENVVAELMRLEARDQNLGCRRRVLGLESDSHAPAANRIARSQRHHRHAA